MGEAGRGEGGGKGNGQQGGKQTSARIRLNKKELNKKRSPSPFGRRTEEQNKTKQTKTIAEKFDKSSSIHQKNDVLVVSLALIGGGLEIGLVVAAGPRVQQNKAGRSDSLPRTT